MTFKDAFNSGCRFKLPHWHIWLIKVDSESFKLISDPPTESRYLLTDYKFYNEWTDWETDYQEVFNNKLKEILDE